MRESAPWPPRRRKANRWLFGPAPDILLGCGVAYMAFFVAMVFAGPQLRAWLPMGMLPLVSVFFGTPHYGATLLRVYEQRSERRAYAFFTVWLTLVVAVLYVGGLYSAALGSFLLSLYLTWSPWHYTGQNYGVSLVFLRRRGIEITPTTKRLLYASFVLSYFLTFLAIHGAAYSGDYAPIEYNGSIYHFLRFGIPAPYWGYAWADLRRRLRRVHRARGEGSAGPCAARRGSRSHRAGDGDTDAVVLAAAARPRARPALERRSVPPRQRVVPLHLGRGGTRRPVPVDHRLLFGEEDAAARVRYYAKCIFAGSAIWSLPAILYVVDGVSRAAASAASRPARTPACWSPRWSTSTTS